MGFWACPHYELFFQDWEEDEAAMEVTEDKENHAEEEDMNDDSKANGDSDMDPESEEE